MKVERVENAIELLGFMEVRRAALSLACMSWALTKQYSAYCDPLLLRRRATVVACAAEDLASAADRKHIFDYFEAGMYCDIGFLFLATHMPKHLDKARVAAISVGGRPLPFCEMAHYGCTHADISAMAGAMRGLPQKLVDAVRHHHTPWFARESEPIADVLHVASLCADQARIMPVFGWPPCAYDVGAFQRLGVLQDDANKLFASSIARADSYLSALPLRDAA